MLSIKEMDKTMLNYETRITSDGHQHKLVGHHVHHQNPFVNQ